MINMDRKIVAIIDQNGDFSPQYYDITNMKGELREYYECDEDGNPIFQSYDEYEADMIERGAVHIHVIEHEI